jgi:hypothetical protein
MIKSRFGSLVWIPVLTVFFFLAATVFAFVIKNGPPPNSKIALIVGTIIIIVVSFHYLRTITVSPCEIIVKNIYSRKTIAKKDIELIEPFAYAKGFLCIRITYKNDRTACVYDCYYTNIHAVKLALREHYANKIKPPSLSGIGAEYDEAEAQHLPNIVPVRPRVTMKFAGRSYATFPGIFIYVLIPALVIASILGVWTNAGGYIFAGTLSAIIYFSFRTQLYYFKLTNQQLTVKNHVVPWLRRDYPLHEIVLINYETLTRRANAIRVITKDRQSIGYCGSSLHDKHWDDLINNLRALNVPINRSLPY